jgi:hypothetical protein
MSPAHRRGRGRWLVVALVVAVLVGLGVVTRHSTTSNIGGPPAAPAAMVSAPDAESSAWYCTGATTSSGQLALGATVFTNTTTRSVIGTVVLSTETGAQVHFGVSIPPHGLVVPTPSSPSSGSWTAESIILSHGGVAVSQAVHGAAGWSETPCLSRTSPVWYFPVGSTSGSNGLFLSMFDPTSTPVVVDLTFFTASGPIRPINFQGIVLQPGGVEEANVSAYVQNEATLGIEAATRTGQIVASELEEYNGANSGLSLVNGVPEVDSDWTIPESEDVSSGASALEVLNPGSSPEKVKVQMRLGAGELLAPFTDTVAPESTWLLLTSNQTRIPLGDPYSTVITATGGSGVVVGRAVEGPTGSQSPQAGQANALDSLTTAASTHAWVVPSPGTTSMPAPSGALPEHLALLNLSAKSQVLVVTAITPTGDKAVTTVRLAPHGTSSIGGSVLFRAGLYPLLVRGTGAAAVSEDVGPAGAFGVVTMPGIPLQADGG